METLTANDKLEHAWRYFALHAAQRIKVFNFFLFLFGLASAGLAGCIQRGGNLLPIGGLIGVVLVVLAFTFWKLDQRTAFLVKHAEEALKKLEVRLFLEDERLFTSEPTHTKNSRALQSTVNSVWSYTRCFGLVFIFASAVGVLGVLLALFPPGT